MAEAASGRFAVSPKAVATLRLGSGPVPVVRLAASRANRLHGGGEDDGAGGGGDDGGDGGVASDGAVREPEQVLAIAPKECTPFGLLLALSRHWCMC